LQGWRLVINDQNKKGFVPGNYLKSITEEEYLNIQKKKQDEQKKKEDQKKVELQKKEAQRKLEAQKKAEEQKKIEEEKKKQEDKRKLEEKRAAKAEGSETRSNRQPKDDKGKNKEEEGQKQLTMAEAKYDYNHPDSNSTEFFSFKTGDRFTVLLNSPDLKGWTIVLNSKNEKGFVPGNYLNIMTPEEVKKQDSVKRVTSKDSGKQPSRKDLQRGNSVTPSGKDKK